MACHGAPLLSGAYINDAFSLRLRQFSILPVLANCRAVHSWLHSGYYSVEYFLIFA